MREPAPYIGRFAPSPTGPLHFGSLLAAVASYLEARQRGGQWLVRVEDIDPPREQPGASELIIATLEHYGFEWDGPIIYQSQSDIEHRAALRRLADDGLAYPCSCSRRDLAEAPRGPLGTIYPGTCRNGCDATETAIRLRTSNESLTFDDELQGTQSQRLESESGDFVTLRRDGLVAYHLAVVVDDYLQGVTHIVRGIDLMDSTLRQIWVQQKLGYPTPRYSHIPVALHEDGRKLSKVSGASGILPDQVAATLVAALQSLGQKPPESLVGASVNDIWAWALANWNMNLLRGQVAISTLPSTLAGDKNPLR
ncbi:MAG: tRNA glutamyl-Q(34) synthetase GluQRS [Gammaproteobacteria bacterium]|nr:tRNA glutamyl-Q(34) synthetase GluQRS [Gammaproteobacteria bacterium]